jgi:hypothetical protein
MTKKTNLMITATARSAATKLASFAAVEVEAQKRLEAAQAAEPGDSFGEFLFSGGKVQGVLKVNNVVLKIES